MALKLQEVIIGPGHILHKADEIITNYYILVEGTMEVYF